MKKLLFLVALSIGFVSSAQTVITTGNTMTPEQLVNNILVGQGVTISNVMFNGSAVNAQSVQTNALDFTATNFPFTNGVYLRTQTGGSVAFDPDLNAISTNTITNGAILEFDFVPTGDSLVFNYMFASAEYPTYVCSGFNDVFGFFISGPGISGPYSNGAENIALIPGTTVPVAINTVNSGVAGGAGNPATCAAQDPNWQSNSIYYTTIYANYSGAGFNGGTVSLPALAALQCGQTYHIKMAVSNVGDTALDSGVYIEGNSFSSNAVNIDVNTVTGDSTIYEGCTDAIFIFSRPGDLTDTLIVDYDISGTATSGADYTPLPFPITFLPGEDTILVTLTPLLDGLVEPGESVIITAYTISPCGDTLTTQGTLWIYDELYLQVPPLDTLIVCPTDSSLVWAGVSGGISPYTYNWTGFSSTTNEIWVNTSSQGTTDYYFTVSDACGYNTSDTLTVTVGPNPLIIDSLVPTLTSPCFLSGGVQAYYSGTTGSETMVWSSPQANVPPSVTTSGWTGILPGWYFYTLTEGTCSISDSVYVGSMPDGLSIDDLTAVASNSCVNNGSVVATVTSAPGNIQYLWTSSATNTPSTNNTLNWSNVAPGWYYFTVTQGNCSENDSIEVTTIPLPVADFSANTDYGCNPLTSMFTNNSTGAVSYNWDFGNGNTLVGTGNTDQIQMYTNSSTIMLVAFDGANCSDTAYLDVTVITCGCMDPTATNYNPDAVQDDGSCVYPLPSVNAPNIFTPNADGENDFYFLTVINATEVEMVIVNRWGNTMYTVNYDPEVITQSMNPGMGFGWDGMAPTGSPAEEGTYFVNYRVKGINGDEVTGHSFLQLVRE